MQINQRSKVGHRVPTSPAAPRLTIRLLSSVLISHVSPALATIPLFQITLWHFTWSLFLFFILVSALRCTTNGFTLISRRALIKMPVKIVAELQGQFSLSNGHSQLKIMIKFLQKMFFILNYQQQSTQNA